MYAQTLCNKRYGASRGCPEIDALTAVDRQEKYGLKPQRTSLPQSPQLQPHNCRLPRHRRQPAAAQWPARRAAAGTTWKESSRPERPGYNRRAARHATWQRMRAAAATRPAEPAPWLRSSPQQSAQMSGYRQDKCRVSACAARVRQHVQNVCNQGWHAAAV